MPIFTSHVSASTAVTASQYKVDTSLLPDANDGASIGAAGTAFSDVFLAEGGVINWDSGDATLTQAGNVVTLAGATFAGTLSTAAQPNITSVGTLSALTVSGATLSLTKTGVGAGSMDNVSIGATTPAAGAFTTLSSTGNTVLGSDSNDTITLNGIDTGTDNTVLVVNGQGVVLTDEIDSRVWGSTLVDASGTPVNNQLAVWTDANTVEGDSKVTWDGAIFAVDGDITANQYIVSSSVTYTTQSFSSGSTIFGDTLDDRHEFTGSLFTKGTGSFDNGINATVLTSAQPNITSIGTLEDLEVTRDVDTYILISATQQVIDGMEIGGTTAAAGTFTNMTATGTTTLGTNTGITTTIGSSAAAGTQTAKIYPATTFYNNLLMDNGKNVSGSSTSTGSFGLLVGDGAGITNLTSAAISSYTNSSNNRVITSVDGNTVNGEANLTFDGSTLTVTGTITGSAVKDEDNMSSNSATALATQQSIKAYVDSSITAQDLDATTDSGTIDIDLDSEALTVAGGTGINTSATGTTITIAGEDSDATNKGIVIVEGGTNATVDYLNGTATVNVADAFIKNNASDETSGTITAGGFTTTGALAAGATTVSTLTATGNISGSAVSTGSFGHIYTAGGGVTAGTILPDADNAYDLGSAAYRFANLYVGDLMMSNKSRGGNEVDGTYGDYTIQEGEEDLYLLNHRNGKTYRFKLEEVDSRPWYKKIFS